MSQSTLNSFIGTIPAGTSFTGKPEVMNGSISIVCFLNHLVDLTLTVYQSPDGVNYFLTDTFLASVAVGGVQSRVQFYTKGIKGYIVLTNAGAVDATSTVLRTLYTPNNHDGTLIQPSYVILEGSTVPVDISGSVVVSSQPHLSYLTDNVAVATMPPITGTVAVSSQPHLSYLTDNVAVATMPAITGTVAVSSQPHLSYLTDNVAVATMPYLSKTTDSVDISGQTVVLGSSNNVIGKVLTFENPSSVISLTGISTTGQTIKASAGSLFNITVFNDGNAISYLKLYDVAVPTNADTPVMTFPVLHDSPINTISIHNYQFSTAIGVRATANYIANDTTAPNGTTSMVAFFNGILP